MVKKIGTRISDLEARLKGPPRRVCPECGAENGGRSYFEHHNLDGTISYEPEPPCPGCAKLLPPGRIRKILICALHTYGLECSICGPPHPAIVERRRYLEQMRGDREPREESEIGREA